MSIPHQVFFFWSYGTHISYIRYLSMASWRYHHPDWALYCYQSDFGKTALNWNFHEFQNVIRKKSHDYSDEAKSILGVQFRTYDPQDKAILEMPPPNISDIFSYDTLYRQGGWYSDMDVICVKSHDRISDLDYAFIGFGDLQDWVGQFGAVKGSWVMKSFYDPCLVNFSASSYNSTGTYGIVKNCTSNSEWCQQFLAGDKGLKNWRAPKDMFYPLNSAMTNLLYTPTWEHSKSNTYAVHMYGGNQDYAKFLRTCTGPSYIRDERHQEWLCRYFRSLPDRHVSMLDYTTDPEPQNKYVPVKVTPENDPDLPVERPQ
jgi:hypothetical protein